MGKEDWIVENGVKRRITMTEKYSYLIGQKINKWLVLDIKHDRRHSDAICKCDCGTIKPVNIRNLINNCSKDCGCGRKQMLRETRTKNLVGLKVGKLTVVELLDESDNFNRRLYRCKCDCGNEIIVPSISLHNHHTSSCGCLLSYHNMYIGQLLDKMGIKYQKEYRICLDDKQYRFDFYLPDYNLFIEYDGEQHYIVPRYCSDDEKNQQILIETQKRDRIKDKYCEDNGINLLRIPYWKQKNIDEIISNHLQRLNEKGSM